MSTTTSATDKSSDLAALDPEQLPIPPHERKGAGHFLGLYAEEHVAATEFVIGATFVALGASFRTILIGLVIGNVLAMMTFWLVTAPIATQARLSLYTYLQKITGDLFSKLYNLANAVIFAVISAAMITVSATAIRRIVNVPAQTEAYPTSVTFVIICVVFSLIAVIVAVYGFDILARLAGGFPTVVATATLSAYTADVGLGRFLFAGLKTRDYPQMLGAAILVVALP